MRTCGQTRTAVLICLCTTHKSDDIISTRSERNRVPKTLTIKVRHRRVVLVLDEHVAELDFCAVHVLARQQELGRVSSLGEAMCQDIANLRRETRLQRRKVQLQVPMGINTRSVT